MARKLNAFELAQQGFNRLTQGVGNAVGNYAAGVQQRFNTPSRFATPRQSLPIIQQGANALGSVNMARISPIGNVFPQVRSAFPTLGEYAQNQVIKPLTLAQNRSAPALDRGIGAVQGGFSLTPAGSLFNIGSGIAAGSLRSARTGVPLNQSIKQGVTNPTSIAAQGLGVKNPLLALGLDVVTGNPRTAIKSLKNTKGIVSALKGINPKAFDLHPDDAADLSAIGQKILAKSPLSLQENKTLERTFKYLFPGYKLDKMSNKKIGDVIAATLDRYNGLPKGVSTQFPKMGLVSKSEAEQALQSGGKSLEGSAPTSSALSERAVLGNQASPNLASEAINTSPSSLSQPVKGGILDDIQKGFDQGRKERLSTGKTNVGLKARTELIDKLSPVYDFVKKGGGNKLSADMNPYKQMRLLAGTSGKVEAYLDNTIAPIFKREAGRQKDLSALMLLEREGELIGNGLTRKRTIEQVNQGISELKGKYGEQGYATLKQSADELRGVSDNLREMLVRSGIIDEASSNAMKAKGQYYTPFEAVEHIADNLEAGRVAPSFNVASQDVIKRIGDYSGDVADPLESLVRKIPKIIAIAEKNKAIQTLVDLRKMNPEVYGDLITPIRTAENVRKRIDLFSQAKELKPIQGILKRFVRTHSSTIRRLETQINRLEKRGLDVSLKEAPPTAPPPIMSGIKTRTNAKGTKIIGDVYATTKNRGDQSTRKFINHWVTEPNLDIQALKKQVATRENKLEPLFDDLQKLRDAYSDIRSQRSDLISDARALADAKSRGRSIINVFRDGINETYEVPDVVESAVKNLDAQTSNILTNVGAWQAKVLRAGATSLNIGFIPVNIVRDVQDALTTELSERGVKAMFQFLGSYPQAILSAAGKGKLYREWAASGGLQSTMLEQILKSTTKSVSELSGKRNLVKMAIGSPKSAVEFLNRVGEQSTRLARFKSGLARGEGAAEAAFKSRDISLDFAKSGNSIKALNQVIPFLNAGIQGSEKLLRLYKTNPKAALASTSIMFGVPTVALYKHNSQFQDYSDIPDSEKQNNWIIIARDRTPEEIAANEKVIGLKIPKGFLGRIVANTIEAGMTFADKRDPQTFVNSALDTIEGISPVGLPVDGERAGRTASKLLPPAAKAGVEALTNRNLYFGSPIVSQGLQNLPPEEQYREKTPGIYKIAGKLTGKSPLILENTVNSMTGGLGKQAAQFFSGDIKGSTIDQVTRRFSGVQGGVKADKAYQTVEKEKQYTALRNKQLKEAYASGDQEEFNRLSEGMSSQQIKTLITNQKKKDETSKLSPEQKAYETLTKEEKARLLKERPELQSSVGFAPEAGAEGMVIDTTTAPGITFVSTPDSVINSNVPQSLNINSFDSSTDTKLVDPKFTGNTELDKMALSKYQSSITKHKKDIAIYIEEGKLTPDQGETLLQGLKQKLEDVKSQFDQSKPNKFTSFKLTGNDTIDKELISNQISAYSTEINNIAKYVIDGKLTPEQGEELVNKIRAKQKELKYGKRTGSGGGGRKAKKVNYKGVRITAKAIKIPSFKKYSIPKTRIPKYKPTKRVKIKYK